jgi:hypothetical protein
VDPDPAPVPEPIDELDRELKFAAAEVVFLKDHLGDGDSRLEAAKAHLEVLRGRKRAALPPAVQLKRAGEDLKQLEKKRANLDAGDEELELAYSKAADDLTEHKAKKDALDAKIKLAKQQVEEAAAATGESASLVPTAAKLLQTFAAAQVPAEELSKWAQHHPLLGQLVELLEKCGAPGGEPVGTHDADVGMGIPPVQAPPVAAGSAAAAGGRAPGTPIASDSAANGARGRAAGSAGRPGREGRSRSGPRDGPEVLPEDATPEEKLAAYEAFCKKQRTQ